MNADASLREHLVALLDWKDAHATFDKAVEGVAAEDRGKVPDGATHSIWQVVEHLRLAQRDILDFCVNAKYEEPDWPDDYWPLNPAPPSAAAWDESLAGYREDRGRMMDLAKDASTDLFARIPHGTGQTYLREILLVADHNAYHIGQIVLIRRLLGIWPGA
ncbi:MAG TPA: DinB family protein [Candidatus Eisenbacteria bacterium]|nr:DinB family protein [Candidatus Eisenbacteria bacterium]